MPNMKFTKKELDEEIMQIIMQQGNRQVQTQRQARMPGIAQMLLQKAKRNGNNARLAS